MALDTNLKFTVWGGGRDAGRSVLLSRKSSAGCAGRARVGGGWQGWGGVCGGWCPRAGRGLLAAFEFIWLGALTHGPSGC